MSNWGNKPPRHRGKGKKSKEENQDYDDFDEEDDDDDDFGEALSVSDAALIYGFSGMDEDYTFGYDEDELKKHL